MRVKTHLIVTDMFDEYKMKWIGRLIELKPIINKNGTLNFSFVSGNGRSEVSHYLDLAFIERVARKLTRPKGRAAVTYDDCKIYVDTEDRGQVLIGVLGHSHIKEFAPMYDEID